MNAQCFAVVSFVLYCYIAKSHGSEQLLPPPEENELSKLILQNEENQHWVETPTIAEEAHEDHQIVKRQSGLNLVQAVTNTAALQTAVVNKHNELRSNEALHENAALMKKMYGNSDLANFAKALTNTCYYDHSHYATRMNKFGFPYFGENLAVVTGGGNTPESIIQSWYNEKQYYDYNTNKCRGGRCGHYTQVVWGNSKYVGCAVTYCPVLYLPNHNFLKNAYFFACNYGPGGNYINQRPYIKSTKCAGCSYTCVQGLCDKHAVTTTTTTAAPTTTTTLSTTTTGVPTIPGCVSVDKNKYCASYNSIYSICSGTNGYLNFAINNCKHTCKFCQCRDFVNTCSSYVSKYNICAYGTRNYWYGCKYCKKTCFLC